MHRGGCGFDSRRLHSRPASARDQSTRGRREEPCDHDETAGGTLAMTWELDLDYLTFARFAQLVVERGFGARRLVLLGDRADDARGLFDRALTTHARAGAERAALLDLTADARRGVPRHLSLQHGRRTSSRRRASARRARRRAGRGCASGTRSSSPRRSSRSAITFWSQRPQRPQPHAARSTCRPGPRSPRNYPAAVPHAARRAHGAELRAGESRPADPLARRARAPARRTRCARSPGSGASWCDLHYITDPETFFGVEPGVHARRAARRGRRGRRCRALAAARSSRTPASCSPPTRRQRTGQGLSRLLNVVDGLIGQGLRVLVLVTTNEPLAPPPGRLAAGPLRRADRVHGVPAGGGASLARAHGRDAAAARARSRRSTRGDDERDPTERRRASASPARADGRRRPAGQLTPP